ncbi:MAG: Gfo/Idh/MocA family oxidoreductase [Hungatella sp.]|nr:Gfo/Idh/MocA family oxidoreductase [Hungatella sp.]
MRIGVTGNGNIVKRFLKDASEVETVKTISICVREQSRHKGEELALAYGMEACTDYEEFLGREDMDAVYIGLINIQHYPYARQALLAGKHVICEKPLTVTWDEAKELADLARERGLFLWEAFKLPFNPAVLAVKKHIDRLGPVRLVQCSYCRTGKVYEEYLQGAVRPVLDPKCAGGSLYDVNVYNLHFAVWLFGKPEGAEYFTAHKGFNGADTSGTAILRYPGFQAICTAAMDCGGENFSMVQGEKGWIKVEGPVSSCLRAVLNAGGMTEIIGENPEKGRLKPEITEFARQFHEGDYKTCYETLEHSLTVMEVLEQCRKGVS